MNPSLAEFFPLEQKREYIDNKIFPGMVLRVFCNFKIDPHPKFIVILHKDKRPLFFFINTNINGYISIRPKLFNCQIEIKKEPNHTFLDHDSWINCSEVKTLFSYEEIVSMLINDLDGIKWKIDQITIDKICEKVKSADSIIPVHKKIILANFS